MKFDVYVTRRGTAGREEGPFVVEAAMIGKTATEIGHALVAMLFEHPLLLLHTQRDQDRVAGSRIVSGPDGKPVSTGIFGGTVYLREDISKIRIQQQTEER